MATVRVTYYGMDGEGRNLTEAKRDAGRKIEEALAGDYTPEVVAYRGYVALVARDPAGWDHRLIVTPEDGPRVGPAPMHGGNNREKDDAVRSARMHVAHLGWTLADGLVAPEILRSRDEQREFLSWAEHQIRYAAALAAGLGHWQAHSYAGRDPARPELQAMVPDPLATVIPA